VDKRVAVVTGATGVAGRAIVERLVANGAWDVVAVSRRKPDVAGRYRHLAVDLSSAEDCQAKFATLAGVTHIFCTAYVEVPGQQELCDRNLPLLANPVRTIEAVSPALAHIFLLEGTKWYGSHLGRFRTPTREDDPRHAGPNFYYAQQDWLSTQAAGKRWTWSAARPHAILGYSLRTPMNLLTALAIYALVCRELGMPLSFPGHPANFGALYQCTDARLLARAAEWMATTPHCANEAYNVTNGDLIRWENFWPRVARYFDMPVGAPQRVRVAEFLADKAPVWERIVARHGLVATPFADIASATYLDRVFAPDYDVISSLTKLRQHGFGDALDTEDNFVALWDELRAARILP